MTAMCDAGLQRSMCASEGKWTCSRKKKKWSGPPQGQRPVQSLFEHEVVVVPGKAANGIAESSHDVFAFRPRHAGGGEEQFPLIRPRVVRTDFQLAPAITVDGDALVQAAPRVAFDGFRETYIVFHRKWGNAAKSAIR